MDFDKLNNTEKIAMVELAMKIHMEAQTKKLTIVYENFEECAKGMVEKARKVANAIG